MRIYNIEKCPVDYQIDRTLLKLASEANKKYGEYKVLLATLKFDRNIFFNLIQHLESYKSTQIEGMQISQDEMYYLKYMDTSDESKEIQNLKNIIQYAFQEIEKGSIINFTLVNKMHRMILDSVRGSEKNPGQIRTTQNWIGPRGVGIEGAIFIPPVPEDIYELLLNLYEYMNDAFIDPLLVNIGLSHAQFETIHAYKDGNGRLGRALIPVQLALLDQEKPILYMSEILELYKPAYQRNLMETRKGNYLGYLKFFLQCVIDQCNSYIYKIKRIKDIYYEDMKKVEEIKGGLVYKIMPISMTQIVFTKKEIESLSQVSLNSVSRIIDQLVELDIIVKDDTITKRGYRYQRIYEVFVGNQEYL